MAHGPLALVGSGEFLPAMAAVDVALLEGRARRVAVIPTAAAPEGEATTRRWFDLAHRHYEGLGSAVVEVDVRDRDDAEDPAMAELVAGCGLVYLSGGDPGFLAGALRGTALAAGIAAAWRAGAAVAGCSAGAMALGRRTLAVRGGGVVEGMGLAGPVTTIPHFDRFDFATRYADLVGRLVDQGQAVIGVDEETAVVWHPGEGWRVDGARKVWLVDGSGGRGEGFAAGDRVRLPAPA